MDEYFSNSNFNECIHSNSNFKDLDISHRESTGKNVTLPEQHNMSNACLDSVRSGESLIKCYTFDSASHKDTAKIVAFWKALEEHKEIQPVKSTFYMSGTFPEAQKGGERGDSVNSDRVEKYIWYNTLMEMKKHKLDKVALAATGWQCKFCDLTESCRPKPQTNQTEYNTEEAQEVIKLNDWKSQSLKKTKSESTTCFKRYLKENSNLEKNVLEEHDYLATNQPIKEIDEIFRRETNESNLPNAITEVSVCSDISYSSESNSSHEDEHNNTPITDGKFEHDHLNTQNQVQEDDLLSDQAETPCSICLYEPCMCSKHLDEQAEEFIEELKDHLAQLHKADLDDNIKDIQKTDASCCQICDDPHVCALMNKDLLTGEIKLPVVQEDDCLKIIFNLNTPIKSTSDIILAESEKETKDDFGHKTKKVTYIKADESTVFDQLDSAMTPTASRCVSITNVQRKKESNDSLIIYVEPLSWYSSETHE